MLDIDEDQIRNNDYAQQTILADVQTYRFQPEYDLCFSRFGMMFFSSPVFAMRNIRSALKPGGRFVVIDHTAPAGSKLAATDTTSVGITPRKLLKVIKNPRLAAALLNAQFRIRGKTTVPLSVRLA